MRHRERGSRTTPDQDQSDPDHVLDALLAGFPLPPGEDQAGLQPVADVLAALRAPAAPAELTGQASALAAFRDRPHHRRSHRPQRQSHALRRTLLRPGPVTALAAGVVVVAGLTAAGYEGDLPAAMQQWAHHEFGLVAHGTKASPSSDPSPHRSSPRPSPDPSPRHHRPSLAEHHPGQDGPKHQQQQPGDGHRPSGHDSRHPRGQQSPSPSSTGGRGGNSPSPSPSPTPTPSKSPAVQSSPAPSPSPSPHHHDTSSPSSSP